MPKKLKACNLNIFKKYFGKKNWETLWSSEPTETSIETVKKTSFFNHTKTTNQKVSAVILIQLERDRKWVRGIITTGEIISHIELSFVAAKYEEAKKILDEWNVIY